MYEDIQWLNEEDDPLPGPGVRCKSSSKPPRLLLPVIVNIGACFLTLCTVLPSIPGKPYAFGAKETMFQCRKIPCRLLTYQVYCQVHNFYVENRMYMQVVTEKQFS